MANKKALIRDSALMIAGTGLMAASVQLFFDPVGMVPGGFTGLAMIINKLTQGLMDGGFPLWAGNIVLNVPLILISMKVRGWKFVRRTFAASLIYSAWLYVIPLYAAAGDDLIIAALVGGALMGTGCGLVFRARATTGGTDTMAALIKKALPHIPAARIYPVIDGIIIILAMWIFGVRISLYALVSVFVSGKLADRVTSGGMNSNMAFIISDRAEEISNAIMKRMDRGVTKIDATGMYTSSDRKVLMCAVSTKETVVLKEIVKEIDPSAFFVLTDTSEVRGEGFLDYTWDEL
ncbi:MAG: YitT family protein [Oscillospiraceae bacterium]